MKSMKKRIIIISIIFILFILLITTVMININYIKINLQILNSKSENIEIYATDIKLWKSSLNKMKKNNESITLIQDKCEIILNTDQIKSSKKINLKVESGNGNSDYKNLENINVYQIQLKSPENINFVKEIKIEKEEEWDKIAKLDLYTIDKSNETKYIETIDVDNSLDKITIIPKNNIDKFILCYIPVKDIVVDEENIELNKGEKYKINYTLEPKNATNKSVKIELEENVIKLMEDDSTIEGIDYGEAKIVIKAENETIEKYLNVKVNAVTEDIWLENDNINIYEEETFQIVAKALPEEAINNKLIYKSNNENIATVDEDGNIKALKRGKTNIVIETEQEPRISKVIPIKVNKKRVDAETQEGVYANSSNTQIGTYINGILIVNKNYSLPYNYAPGVNSEALAQFNVMKEQASRENINLKIVSGYRSYQLQESIYNRNVNLYGEEVANTFSAKPGQSEHQSGLAFDINSTRWDFEYTAEGQWLANNCYNYGFIIRYLKNKEHITGYSYEPWHIRYVGIQHSMRIKETGQCLEEYLGIN